jgi:hypothetical protein
MGYSDHISTGGFFMPDEYFRCFENNLSSFLDEKSMKHLDELMEESRKDLYKENSSILKADLATQGL